MKREALNTHLQDLHDELKKATPETAEGRKKIEVLSSQIAAQLKRSDELQPAEHQTLLQLLRDAVEHFEESHPELTVRMSTLVNLLSSSGF
jgi:hypothetical protein